MVWRLPLGSLALASALMFQLPLFGAASSAAKDPAFTDFFRRTNGWEAGDGAISVALSGGRTLWLFGDSYVDQLDPATKRLPCMFNARNAALLQSLNDPQHPETLRAANGGRSFFRPPAAKVGDPWPCFWPGAGYEHGGIVWVSLMEIQKTPEGGVWGFKLTGQYWGAMQATNLTSVIYTKLPSFNGISFANGFVPDEARGCVHAFGEKGHGIASDVYVARFPINDPAGPWSFWNGRTWVPNITNAAPVAQGNSTSVNVCRARGKFLLFSTEFSVACDQGRQIFLSVSERPTGPFSAPKSIYTIDDPVQGHQPFFYGANAHPESINAQGELLVTYCINGYEPCVPSCVNGRFDADYYRPRAIRVLVGQIDRLGH